MSEEMPQPEASAEATGAGDVPAVESEEQDRSNAEAARYRRRLRETEAERDRLAEQVTRLQTAEVERRVADALEDPADVWRDGLTLADVVDEQGQVDEHALDTAVLQVATDHPGWRKRPEGTEVDVDQGRRSELGDGVSWAGMLRRDG